MALAKISRTILNNNGESGHQCLVLFLSETSSKLFPNSIILAVGLSYIALIVLKNVPAISNLLEVIVMK